MSLEQCALVGDVKRPARGDQLNAAAALAERRLDAARNIEVLWRCSEGRELLAPGGGKDAPWVLSDRRRCRFELSTMIQRSPSRWAQGGRRMARTVPAIFPASTAFAFICTAKGWVASTRRSKALLGDDAREPSAPPNPPVSSLPGRATGSKFSRRATGSRQNARRLEARGRGRRPRRLPPRMSFAGFITPRSHCERRRSASAMARHRRHRRG